MKQEQNVAEKLVSSARGRINIPEHFNFSAIRPRTASVIAS
jgi:hypothetical protein